MLPTCGLAATPPCPGSARPGTLLFMHIGAKRRKLVLRARFQPPAAAFS
jgi:hypothetical protein